MRHVKPKGMDGEEMSIQDGYERAALGQMEKARLVDIIMRQRRQADKDYDEARRQLAEAQGSAKAWKTAASHWRRDAQLAMMFEQRHAGRVADLLAARHEYRITKRHIKKDADLWQKRALYAAEAVRLLIRLARTDKRLWDAETLSEEELAISGKASAWSALPAWMRITIERRDLR